MQVVKSSCLHYSWGFFVTGLYLFGAQQHANKVISIDEHFRPNNFFCIVQHLPRQAVIALTAGLAMMPFMVVCTQLGRNAEGFLPFMTTVFPGQSPCTQQLCPEAVSPPSFPEASLPPVIWPSLSCLLPTQERGFPSAGTRQHCTVLTTSGNCCWVLTDKTRGSSIPPAKQPRADIMVGN